MSLICLSDRIVVGEDVSEKFDIAACLDFWHEDSDLARAQRHCDQVVSEARVLARLNLSRKPESFCTSCVSFETSLQESCSPWDYITVR